MGKKNWVPVYALLMAMLLWASSFIALKVAIQQYDPMVVIFGRMIVASAAFLFVVRRFRKLRFKARHIKYMLLMAFFEPCLYFIFEAKAIQNTTASQAGMITAMLPLMVAWAAFFILKEQIARRTIIGFIMAVVGAVWLSVGSEVSEYAPNPPLGNFLEFMAMVCATGYTITLKRLTAVYPPLFLTGLQAVAGALFFFPFLFLPSTTLPVDFQPVPVMAIVYLGTVITLGAYGFYNYGVSRIPANQASAFVNLIPVFTVVMGWAILDERLTLSQTFASAIVLAGVFISQQSPLKRSRRRLSQTDRPSSNDV